MGVLERFVFQRDRDIAIEKKESANAKFAAQADREPYAILLPAVVDREADAGEVSSQESAHPEGQTTRQPGEDVDRLEFLRVDVGLAGPIRVVIVFRSEGDVVGTGGLRMVPGP